MTKTTPRQDAFAIAALISFILISFSAYLFGDRTLQESAASTSSLYAAGARPSHGDEVRYYRELDPGASAWQTEPWFALEHHIVGSEHAVPLWNPYSAYGAPLLANMQSQPLSPVAWPAIALRSALGYDLWIVFRLLVAALSTYAFCRLFFGSVASFCGGLGYAFCGYLQVYLAMPEQSVYCVLPAIFVAVEIYSRKRDGIAIAGVACASALLVLGGMPESAFLIFVAAALYTLVRCAVFGTLAGTILGFGLSGALLLPFLEYVRNAFTLHSGTVSNGTISDALNIDALATYVSPLAFGPPYNDIFQGFTGWTQIRNFFGAAVAILALASLFDRFEWLGKAQRFPRLFFAALAIGLLMKRFGLAQINWVGALPIFRQVLIYKYEEPILSFCVAVLAACAVDRLVRDDGVERRLWPASALVLALLTAVAAEHRSLIELGIPHHVFYLASLLFSLAIIAGFVSLAIVHRFIGLGTNVRAGGILVLVAISAIGSFFVPMYYLVDRSASRAESALLGAPYIAEAKRNLSDGRRFFSPESLLYPGWSAAFQIADVRALDAIYDQKYLPFLRAFLKSDEADFLTDRFTGVKNIDFGDPLVERWMQLSSIGVIAVDQSYRGLSASSLLYDDGNVKLYRTHDTLTPVAGFTSVRHVASETEALAVLTSPSFDPLRSVVVQSAPNIALGADERFSSPRIEASSSTYLRATSSLQTQSFALVTSTNYPGWEAFVDGKSVPIYAANYLFRGIVVPAGTHVLEFKYQPRSFVIGSCISVASLAVLLVLVLFGEVRKRSRKGDPA